MAIVMREKKIFCGDNFLEVDIYPRTEEQDAAALRERHKKENVTPPPVKAMNDKRSKRFAGQMIMTNYWEGDWFVTLTFDDDHLPSDWDEADKQLANFFKRINYHRKRRGGVNIKYFVVDGGLGARPHYHFIVPSDTDIKEMIRLWGKGYVHTKLIQADEDGRFDDLLKYMESQHDEEVEGQESIEGMVTPPRRRRFRYSKNLEKPQFTTNDSKFTKRKAERLAKAPPTVEEIEKLYPGWTPIANGFSSSFNDVTGLWYLHFRLKRKINAQHNQNNGAGSKNAKQTTAPKPKGTPGNETQT